MYDHPWLVMTNDLRDWKVARGETVHDMKPVNPRFPEQGYTRTAKRQRPSWGGSVKTVSPTRQPAAEGAPHPRGAGSAAAGGRVVEEESPLASGRVGWGRLELVDDLVLSGVGLGLLHLGEQLESLLLLLRGVVAQEVGCGGQDGGSTSSRHQVEANGKRDVHLGPMVLLMLLLLRQDELRSPVGKADDGGTLQDWGTERGLAGTLQPLYPKLTGRGPVWPALQGAAF